jgi:hypothetical protein
VCLGYKSLGGEMPSTLYKNWLSSLGVGTSSNSTYGADEVANMSPLDLSVNRSLDAQIGAQLRGVPVGTCVIGVQIC